MGKLNLFSKISFFSEPIINKLYILFFIFLFTIIAVVSVENYFDSAYTQKHQLIVTNQEQLNKLDNLLSYNIQTLQIKFIQFPFITHPQQLKNTEDEIRILV